MPDDGGFAGGGFAGGGFAGGGVLASGAEHDADLPPPVPRQLHVNGPLPITVDGKPIKAVVQVTKQAFAYVFDRVTGKPVWPIDEQPVPASSVPGEQASATQPIPSKPAPFDIQGATDDNLIDLTPEIHQEAIAIANGTGYGLVAGVWSADGGRQMRLAKALRAGQVFLNNYGAGGGVELPFGGVGKSGHGREKGFEALYGFSTLKTVAAWHG